MCITTIHVIQNQPLSGHRRPGEITRPMKKEKNESETAVGQNIICRASIKGTVTKEQLYIILNYIDDMKKRGYVFEKHDRKDLQDDKVVIDYILIKHDN